MDLITPAQSFPKNRNPSPGCLLAASAVPCSQALTRYFPPKVFSGSAFNFSQAKVGGVTWEDPRGSNRLVKSCREQRDFAPGALCWKEQDRKTVGSI